jgi:hypothetical protein
MRAGLGAPETVPSLLVSHAGFEPRSANWCVYANGRFWYGHERLMSMRRAPGARWIRLSYTSHPGKKQRAGPSSQSGNRATFENCALSRTAAVATLWRALAIRLAKSVSRPRRRTSTSSVESLGGVGFRTYRSWVYRSWVFHHGRGAFTTDQLFGDSAAIFRCLSVRCFSAATALQMPTERFVFMVEVLLEQLRQFVGLAFLQRINDQLMFPHRRRPPVSVSLASQITSAQ